LTPLYYRHQTHNDILHAQQLLNKYGLYITETGTLDLITEIGIRLFQRRNQLTIDGILGPRTMTVLKSATPLAKKQQTIQWIYPAPYFSQKDNVYKPNGTCNVTALAMVLSYWGESSSQQLEDELYLQLQTKEARTYFEQHFPTLKAQGYNPRNVHGMLGWLTKQRGYNWKFTEAWNFMLKNKPPGPIVASGKFTGSGHIICVVGQTSDADLIVNDPYGNWERGYNTSFDGHLVIYNKEDMLQTLSPTNQHNKWAHFITK
jgi:uncharacterized protein YvpB